MDITAVVDDGGSVIGTIGGKPVDLRVHQTNQPATRIAGTFNGSLEMLAVIVGAVGYFA